MSFLRKGFLCCTLFLSFLPAANASDVNFYLLRLPDKPLPQVRKIAVFDFQGKPELGRRMADLVISALLEERRGLDENKAKSYLQGARTNVFQLVERSQIAKIFEEQKMSMAGLIDDQDLARLGELIGADVIITGMVNANSEDINKREKRVKRKKKAKDETYYVNCKTRKAEARVSLRIIDVNTAQILGTKEATASETSKRCGSSIERMKTVESLLQKNLEELPNQGLINYFNPFFKKKRFDFEDIKHKKIKGIGKDAKRAAKRYDLDGAYALYKKIEDQDPYNDRVHYNLAILDMMVGNYENSHRHFSMAFQLKDKKSYKKAMDFAQKMVRNSKILAGYNIKVEKHEFQTNKAILSKVKLRGGSDKRHAVQSAPNRDVIAWVPGGISLDVISKEKGWYKVKLIDGKIGYLNEKDVQ